jgi:hypothetical protein
MIKIDIKVDDTLTYSFLEEDNLIEGFSLKRQMDDDLTALNGAVECAEINCTLNNLYNDFNITSSTSPYSQLKNGLEVKAYSVSDTTNNLFTGYLVDFAAPTDTDTQSCNIRAVDRLHILLNKETKTNFSLQIERKINLFDYITRLFASYGVTADELKIDASLSNIILDYTLLNGKKLSEQLNEICKAVDCYIFVSKTGIITIKSKKITGTPVKTFTRQDHSLISSEYGTSLFSSYNTIKVGYVSTQLSEVKEILAVGRLVVPVGFTEVTYDLSVDNLYELDNIKITSNLNTHITKLSATSSTITLQLNNPSQEEDTIDITVYGKTIERTDAFITKSVDTEQTEQGYEVTSILVQKKAYAEDLMSSLYNRAIEPIPYIKAEVEVVDFGVDLGYIVQIVDNEAEIDYVGYVHSIDIEYDGGGYSYYNLGIKALYKESGENE